MSYLDKISKHLIIASGKTNRDSILKANEAGLRHKTDDSIWWSYHTPIYNIAYSLGKDGISLKGQSDVTGYRYGKAKDLGISHNYREDRSEKGLSLAFLEGEQEVGSAMFFKDRKLFKYTGILLPYKGSDGEPLILPYGLDDLE